MTGEFFAGGVGRGVNIKIEAILRAEDLARLDAFAGVQPVGKLHAPIGIRGCLAHPRPRAPAVAARASANPLAAGRRRERRASYGRRPAS